MHSISTSCAICATFILDNLDSSASFNAIDNDNATAALQPNPYPTGTSISCMMSTNLPSVENLLRTASDTLISPDSNPFTLIVKFAMSCFVLFLIVTVVFTPF